MRMLSDIYECLSRPGRSLRTLRHTRLSQLLWRMWLRPRRRLAAYLPGRCRRRIPIASSQLNLIPGPPFRERRGLYQPPFNFTFLNQSRNTGGHWLPRKAGALWLFNLHYFDFWSELEGGDDFQRLGSSWLQGVTPADSLAWHPFPTAKRIVNWIYAFSRWEGELAGDFKVEFLLSLKNQLDQLWRFRERDLGGNHLLVNLTGLLIGRLFFGETAALPPLWQALERELAEQILPDGGHYERSPMYHALVLEDLLALAAAGAAAGLPPPDFLAQTIVRMAVFLDQIRLDGALPLLNDSAEGIALAPERLLAAVAERYPDFVQSPAAFSRYLPESGYFIYRSGAVSFIFDLGPLGPDPLPGHGHSDALSLLLNLNGQPVLTDSGVFSYEPGARRSYDRSAKAHNVPALRDFEPHEHWRSFRTGRRGRPYDIAVAEGSGRAAAWDNSYNWLGVQVGRTVQVLPGGDGIEICDRICGKPRPFVIRYHFAPGWDLSHMVERDTGAELYLEKGREKCSLELRGVNVIIGVADSPYASAFNYEQDRVCVVVEGEGAPAAVVTGRLKNSW